MSRTITVIRRKLGRHRALGQADGAGTIEIDERLKGRPHLEILIHEFLHEWEWLLPEVIVASLAKKLTRFLHKNRVRVIEPDVEPVIGE
jgi:hypothetical protein